jgi:hypothetical protein
MRPFLWRLGALMVLTVASGMAAAADEPQPSPTIAASALFSRFETVFYANRDVISSSGSYRAFPKQDTATLLYPFSYLLAALDNLDANARAQLIENSSSTLVGAKDFLPPVGLGRVHSSLCYIVVLGEGSKFKLAEHFTTNSSQSGVLRVWGWAPRLGEFGEDDQSPSSLYATQLSDRYVLVSNHPDELRQVAERLGSPAHVPMATVLKDWQLVSQRPFWGYRRYKHTQPKDSVAAGTTDVTAGAEALIFFVDGDKNAGVLRLVSSPDDEQTAANINARAVVPRFKRDGPGRWETVIQMSGDEDSFEHLFAVMVFFGFGVYV